MRVSVDIDDDVLLAAKERARKERVSIGKALSALARAGLNSIAAAAPLEWLGEGVGGTRPTKLRRR